tara:strand:- start:477 stop:698 length:222 start_codon:yes stop_codon:yes gene_type:complete
MFPLIAISAFFVLGIAFFAIGKDDFGITRLKEDSNDTYSKDNEVSNPNTEPNNEKALKKVEVSSDTIQNKEVT